MIEKKWKIEGTAIRQKGKQAAKNNCLSVDGALRYNEAFSNAVSWFSVLCKLSKK